MNRIKQGLIVPLACMLMCCSTSMRTATSGTAGQENIFGAKGDSGNQRSVVLKRYNDVITADAVTDNGLFKVHQVKGHYFFEIPNSVLGRDILVVNRITEAAARSYRPQDGYKGYAGDQVNYETMIRFTKGPANKLFIRKILLGNMAADSTANGMQRAVTRSNLQPIVASFDINAFSPDSGMVIDMTDYLNADNTLFTFQSGIKESYELKTIQLDKSYTEEVRSFPLNVEISTVKTYSNEKEIFTYGLNSSLLLLPLKPMKPRLSDPRVGYFTLPEIIDFDDNPQGIKTKEWVKRRRLEPWPEDMDRYRKGELVEPQQPIVFYIDPATPKKWVPYLIQGINDWQKTFEKAGFKNAIYGLEAPRNDSSWSLEDARHNAIVYKPSSVGNAVGPAVCDPRSGEILESHVDWYHNVMELIRNWYMVQAGAIDPNARKLEFDDELMGKLIRFVSSHEIGHTLGLCHNMGSSSTVPVDSLRSKHYVEANGHTPSIMDYARFNYVAQPEDNILEQGIFPRIGLYDEWAIEWGYRVLPEFSTDLEEKSFLNQWVIQKLGTDKRFFFGDINPYDPSCQTEDLGDDPVKASYYGIKNLKRITPHLMEWTRQPNEDYRSNFKKVYNEVITQYVRYIGHVAALIGGKRFTYKTVEEEGPLLLPVGKKEHQRAVSFLLDELRDQPVWLYDNNWFSKGIVNYTDILGHPTLIIHKMLTFGKLLSLAKAAYYNPETSYSINEYLMEMDQAIWQELKLHQPVSLYRRSVQRIYTKRLAYLLNPEEMTLSDRNAYKYEGVNTDIVMILKSYIRQLQKRISAALLVTMDKITRLHLEEISSMLKQALEVKEIKKEIK